MKPHQIAEMVGVSSATVRRWAREEYTEFLSSDAQGGNRLHRSFNNHDVRVIAWIAQMRGQNMAPESIAATLRSAQGNNWLNLPHLPGSEASGETVTMVPWEGVKAKIEAVQEKLSTTEKERDQLQVRLSRTEAENSDLHQKYFTVVGQLVELSKRLADLLERGR